jgi:hypothetical protein
MHYFRNIIPKHISQNLKNSESRVQFDVQMMHATSPIYTYGNHVTEAAQPMNLAGVEALCGTDEEGNANGPSSHAGVVVRVPILVKRKGVAIKDGDEIMRAFHPALDLHVHTQVPDPATSLLLARTLTVVVIITGTVG